MVSFKLNLNIKLNFDLSLVDFICFLNYLIKNFDQFETINYLLYFKT